MSEPTGTKWADKGLGRVYRQDLRSLNFLVRRTLDPEAVKKPRSYTWIVPLTLDQGPDGACVGFGYSHELAARPQSVRGINYNFALTLYHQIQREDPWPGGAYPGASEFYEGTSVLTGAQVIKSLGYYSNYFWALNAREVAEAVGYKGPAVLGLPWYEGMFDPDGSGFLRPTGREVGGHCILAHGVKITYKFRLTFWRTRTWDDVDYDKSYVKVHNSWGLGWADNGNAKISLRDLDLLLANQGEACFPVRTAKT